MTLQVVRRKIKPNPALLSGEVDDTHYVGLENGNLFALGMRVFNSLGDEKCPEMNEWTLGIFV
jgi:hypothetical protein